MSIYWDYNTIVERLQKEVSDREPSIVYMNILSNSISVFDNRRNNYTVNLITLFSEINPYPVHRKDRIISRFSNCNTSILKICFAPS